MEPKDIIKQRRLDRGLTMRALGDLVGVSEATVSRWESGHIATMKQTVIGRLCRVLDISPNEIIPGMESYSHSCNINEVPNNTGTVNTGTINGNVHNNGIITTVSPVPIPDICKMCQSLSPKARAQIDSLVNMLHEMEHGK